MSLFVDATANEGALKAEYERPLRGRLSAFTQIGAATPWDDVRRARLFGAGGLRWRF